MRWCFWQFHDRSLIKALPFRQLAPHPPQPPPSTFSTQICRFACTRLSWKYCKVIHFFACTTLDCFALKRRGFCFTLKWIASILRHRCNLHGLEGSRRDISLLFHSLPLFPAFFLPNTLLLIFSCPEQLNRWPCHSLTHSLSDFWFWHYRVTLETCDIWDIWSECWDWWPDQIYLSNLHTYYLPTCLPTYMYIPRLERTPPRS